MKGLLRILSKLSENPRTLLIFLLVTFYVTIFTNLRPAVLYLESVLFSQ